MNSTTHPVEAEEVMAYLDGELAPQRAAAVAAHLDQCAECAALAGDLRGVSARAAAWQVEPAPAGLSKEVLTAAASPAARQRSVGSPWRKRVFGLPQWAWALAGGLPVALILAAVLTPNPMRARITANETSAIGSLKTINIACVQYSSTYGGFPRALEQLGPGAPPSEDAADLIDGQLASGVKGGYQFIYIPGSTDFRGKVQDYTVTAEPLELGKSGSRSFFADESGVIRESSDGPATAASLELDWEAKASSFSGAQTRTAAPAAAASLAPETDKASGPMIIRTALLTIVTREFDEVRAATENLLRENGGHTAQLNVNNPPGRGRILKAVLRVPGDKLDLVLAGLKQLGRVEVESQTGDEITQTYVDLVARQDNSKHIEQRLVEVLRSRTGKVKEVLEVEKEIARVREEIERMEAKRKSLAEQVEFATVQLELREEFEKKIGVAPPSAGTLLWNAMAEGLDGALQSLLALALLLLRAGPSLLLWGALLFLPGRAVWRRVRAEMAGQS